MYCNPDVNCCTSHVEMFTLLLIRPIMRENKKKYAYILKKIDLTGNVHHLQPIG